MLNRIVTYNGKSYRVIGEEYLGEARRNRERIAALQAKEKIENPPVDLYDNRRAEALETIALHYKEHGPRFISHFAKKFKDRAQAEEYVHEAYLKAIEQWDQPEDWKPWLSTVIFSTAKRLHGREVSRMNLNVELDEEMVGADADSLDDQVYFKQRLDQVRKLISREHPKTQEVLNLYFFEQWTAGEIAGHMEYAHEDSVHSLVRKFRDRHGLTEGQMMDGDNA